jgi:hypothetical protein
MALIGVETNKALNEYESPARRMGSKQNQLPLSTMIITDGSLAWFG